MSEELFNQDQSQSTAEAELLAELADLRTQVNELASELKSLEENYEQELEDLTDELAEEVAAALAEGYALGFAEAERIATDKDAAMAEALVEIQEDYDESMDLHRPDVSKILAGLNNNEEDKNIAHQRDIAPTAADLDMDIAAEKETAPA